jgi:hypothetical protein
LHILHLAHYVVVKSFHQHFEVVNFIFKAFFTEIISESVYIGRNFRVNVLIVYLFRDSNVRFGLDKLGNIVAFGIETVDIDIVGIGHL